MIVRQLFTRSKKASPKKISYADKLPDLPSVSNTLAYLTEDELFHSYNTDIFSGTIKEIRNIEIDFNGHADYRAFAKIEVADVIRGEIMPGEIASILLPAPINVKGLWVEDTDVISHMAIGTSGIFMPLKYDESHYREEAGVKLYFIDILTSTSEKLHFATFHFPTK